VAVVWEGLHGVKVGVAGAGGGSSAHSNVTAGSVAVSANAGVLDFVSVGFVADAGVGPVIDAVGAIVSTIQVLWSCVGSILPAESTA
jgi:hypothetical protein